MQGKKEKKKKDFDHIQRLQSKKSNDPTEIANKFNSDSRKEIEKPNKVGSVYNFFFFYFFLVALQSNN